MEGFFTSVRHLVHTDARAPSVAGDNNHRMTPWVTSSVAPTCVASCFSSSWRHVDCSVGARRAFDELAANGRLESIAARSAEGAPCMHGKRAVPYEPNGYALASLHRNE